MKSSLIFLCIFVAILHLSSGGPLRLQKRAAFYIANETACVVDSTVYFNGDPIPTDDPCEACKCRPPGFACVLKECEVKPGCRAVRRSGHCCPEYICEPTIHSTPPVDNAYLFTNNAEPSSQTTYFPPSTFESSKEAETHPTFQPISNPSFELFGAGGRDSIEQVKPTFVNHDTDEKAILSDEKNTYIGEPESTTNEPKQTLTTQLQDNEKDISPETIHLEIPKEDIKHSESQGQENNTPNVLFKSETELKHDENKTPEISAAETTVDVEEQTIKTEDTSTSFEPSTLKEEIQIQTTTQSDLRSDEAETKPLTEQKDRDIETTNSTSSQEVKNSAADNSKSLRFEDEEKNTATDSSLEDEKEVKETKVEMPITTTDGTLEKAEIKVTENEMAIEHSEGRAEEVKENKGTQVASTTDSTETILESEEENNVGEDVKSPLNTEKKKILLEVSTVPVIDQSSSEEILNTATTHILPKEDEKGSSSETVVEDPKNKDVHLYKTNEENLKSESVATVTTIIAIQKETNQPTSYDTDTTTDNTIKSNTSPENNLLKSLDDITTATTDQKFTETTVKEANVGVEESKKLPTEDELVTGATSTKADAKSRSQETEDISSSTEQNLEVTQTTKIQAEVSTKYTVQPANEQIKETTTQHEKLKPNE